jgi:hypothetical protein
VLKREDLLAFKGDIYWSDTVEDVIRKAKHNGSDPEDVVIDGLDNVEGIVVDSTGRKVDSCQYIWKEIF